MPRMPTSKDARLLRSAASTFDEAMNFVHDSDFMAARDKFRKALLKYTLLNEDIQHISIAPLHEILSHLELKLGDADRARQHMLAAHKICQRQLELLSADDLETCAFKDKLSETKSRIKRELEIKVEARKSKESIDLNIVNSISDDMKRYNKMIKTVDTNGGNVGKANQAISVENSTSAPLEPDWSRLVSDDSLPDNSPVPISPTTYEATLKQEANKFGAASDPLAPLLDGCCILPVDDLPLPSLLYHQPGHFESAVQSKQNQFTKDYPELIRSNDYAEDDFYKKQAKIELDRFSCNNDSPPIPINQLVYEGNRHLSTKKDPELHCQKHPAHLPSRGIAIDRRSAALSSQEQNGTESPRIVVPEEQNGIESPRTGTNTLSEHHVVPEEQDIVVPEAYLVDEESPPADVAEIPSAKVVIPDKWSLTIAGRKINMRGLVLVIVIVVATVALATGLTLKASRDKQAETEAIALKNRASKEQIKTDIERNVLQRNLTFVNIPANDNRQLTLDWILNKDPLKLDVNSPNLHQRFILALMAFDFGSSFEWMSDESECEWPGVSCLDDGKVSELRLIEQNLTGTLPPEMKGLGYLNVLELQKNGFYGTLPEELGGLKDLQLLNIGSNYFSGDSSTLAKLTQLIDLRINNNQLSGKFPEAIGDLRSLKYIDIGSSSNFLFYGGIGDQFTGALPTQLFDLPELIHLDVSGNKFKGTFPSEIIRLGNLDYLDVHDNQFSSSLPSEIGNLAGLTYLSVYMNRLNGTIPSEIGHLHALTFLNANSNEIKGSIPLEIGMLTSLEQLWLNTNKLTSVIPPEIGNLKALTVLDLSVNQLNGTLTAGIGSLGALTNLWLYHNQISGTLPSELRHLQKLAELDISDNKCTGSVPSELASIDTLAALDLSLNQFTGTFPSEFGLLTGLSWLCADNNSFVGETLSDIETC